MPPSVEAIDILAISLDEDSLLGAEKGVEFVTMLVLVIQRNITRLGHLLPRLETSVPVWRNRLIASEHRGATDEEDDW